jgi:hypothetical protein
VIGFRRVLPLINNIGKNNPILGIIYTLLQPIDDFIGLTVLGIAAMLSPVHMTYSIPTTVEQSEPWVDAETVAAHTGFKADHIRKLAANKKIPAAPMQNGKRVFWRFKLSQVGLYFTSQLS